MSGIAKNQFNNFNPNVNIFGVKKGNKPENDSAKVEDKAHQQEVRPQERAQVSASDVLSFMANSSIYTQIAATKQVNPAKYVSAQQKNNIAESMQSFEQAFEKHFEAIVAEVPGISEAAAMSLASKMLENEI